MNDSASSAFPSNIMKVVIFCALMEDIWRPPDPIVAEIPATVHQLSMAAWRRTLSPIDCRLSKITRQSSPSATAIAARRWAASWSGEVRALSPLVDGIT